MPPDDPDYHDKTPDSPVDEAVGGAPSGFVPPSIEELQKLIPAYEFIEFIDKGGMGAVYKARQPSLSRLVALKLLPPNVGTGLSFDKRLRREARTMAKLSHPNIVTVHDFGETSEGHLYFVMEFIEGTDLRHLIREHQLDPGKILPIINQVCDALKYAHDNGVIHRDIKPANILINKDGVVKVADFGLAKRQNTNVEASMISIAGFSVGTPSYMAPEALEDEDVDHRADIYSLGVVIYEMLTGSVPKGAWEPPSKSAEADMRFDEVVNRAMQADREKRFQQADEVSHAFDTDSYVQRQHPELVRRSNHWVPVAFSLIIVVLLTAWFLLYNPVGRQFDLFGLVPRKPAPLSTAEFDRISREMAEWIFTKGGFVQIRTQDEDVYSKSDLPKGVFEIWRISVEEQSTFYDEDLKRLVDFMLPLPTVTNLNVKLSSVTPVGIEELDRVSGHLSGLDISNTLAVSDDSVDVLSRCKKLKILIISPTNQPEGSRFSDLTGQGIERLESALPKTELRIEPITSRRTP